MRRPLPAFLLTALVVIVGTLSTKAVAIMECVDQSQTSVKTKEACITTPEGDLCPIGAETCIPLTPICQLDASLPCNSDGTCTATTTTQYPCIYTVLQPAPGFLPSLMRVECPELGTSIEDRFLGAGAFNWCLNNCRIVENTVGLCSDTYECPTNASLACMNNSGVMQCSPNQCADMATTPPTSESNWTPGTHVNDGARDPFTGACLETVSIFNGISRRCRPDGLSTFSRDCCHNESGIIIDDNTRQFDATMTDMARAGSTALISYTVAVFAKFAYVYATQGAVAATAYASTVPPVDPTTVAIAAAVVVLTAAYANACESDELETAVMVDSGLCHRVETVCVDRWLDTCIQEERRYCCFYPKSARIVHEQGRSQFGNYTWGTGSDPNCRGFTETEFSSLDWSRIDLSEYVGFMVETATNNFNDNQVQSNINTTIEERVANVP